jgi:undecaprenyl-diphosphatase
MWDYIFLGMVQGVFEWIPISSEGVVVLLSRFMSEGVNPVDLSLFLHLGTLLAVLIYFRKDWINILTFKDLKTLKFLFIATLVSLAVGYPFYKMIRTVALGNSLLFLMGFGLLITAYFNKKKKSFNLKFNNLAIISGFLQGLAVMPGLSRSGSTIFGLSFGDMTPSEILRISYLMSAPAVAASSLYLIINSSIPVFEAWPALVSSFIAGILTLEIILKLTQKINFYKFALAFSMLCFAGAIISFLF